MDIQRIWRSRRSLAVLGTGYALPGDPLTTPDLLATIDERFGSTVLARAQTIADRMRIRQRHICRDFLARNEVARTGQSNPELAAQAIRSALREAGMGVRDIGYIVAHTTTPLCQLPPNAALIADELDYHGPYVELRQACTGFANALMIAHGLAGTLQGRVVVLVGSETGSLFFDPASLEDAPDQIVNLVQMGDGAGAIVLSEETAGRACLAESWFGAVGVGRAPGISQLPGARHFDHDFTAIARHGGALFDHGLDAIRASGHQIEDIDLFLPHQVSGRIGQLLSRHARLDEDCIFVNADRLGNTGSAAIWIALAQVRAGSLRNGHTIAALGAESSKYMFGGFVYRHG